MRSNLFTLILLAGLLLPTALLLGFGLSKGGFPVAANIVYILTGAAYLWALWKSRCPSCGWPLMLDLRNSRYLRKKSNDCPRCGSTEDIKF